MTTRRDLRDVMCLMADRRKSDSRISNYLGIRYEGVATMPELHQPAHPVRFVTAASLFDGHGAAINIMRRILQRQGAEVVHLGSAYLPNFYIQ